MIKLRVVGAVLPVLAATVVLTAVPASAYERWQSCSNRMCDYGEVNGNWAKVQDDSADGVGAALDIYLYNGSHPWVTVEGPGVNEGRFDSNVKKARICNYANGEIWSCGAWKYF
ncbi:hypothetical protein [Streptomyces sp. NPDC037389]|uniref:hypothetical protein n=1 Tax=Streptomyces sp. NPDC037389 TaxID=3155369 RepID=UPI0034090D8A